MRWIGWRNRLLASRRLPALRRAVLADPSGRAAPGQRAVRSRRRVHLFAGARRMRARAGCSMHSPSGPLTTATLAGASRAARAPAPSACSARPRRSDLAQRMRRRRPLDARAAQGAALRGNRGIAEMVAHHHLLYADLADPLALLRRGGGGGALQALLALCAAPHGEGRGRAEVAAYSALMAASQPLVAEHVIAAYPLRPHTPPARRRRRRGRVPRRGRGSGCRDSNLALFDLPAVGDRSRAVRRLGDRSDDPRRQTFSRDPLPRGLRSDLARPGSPRS